MFSFVLTFYAYDWFAHGGVKHTMIVVGSIEVGVCMLSIPMCKWFLRFTHSSPPLTGYKMSSVNGIGHFLRVMISLRC
jgi:hypothetical protein